jgi:hypothetical protein
MRPGGHLSMSIINDALKKTQTKLNTTENTEARNPETTQKETTTPLNIYEKTQKKAQEQQNAQPKTEQKSSMPETPLRSAKKWIKTFSITVLILAGLSSGFLSISRSQAAKKFLHSLKKDRPSSKKLITKQSASKPRKYKTGELVLNGTSLIDGKKVALINDEIYEVGEVINGNKITSIDLNKVELLGDEKIITLKVH